MINQLFPNGFMPAVRNNSNALLQGGLGLLSGPTAQQQAALGAAGFAGARSDARKKTATMAWLQQQNPVLAQMYEQGLFDNKALGQYLLQAQMPKEKQNPYMNLGDGRLFNWQTGEFTNAPDSGQAKPLSSVGKINADYNAGLIDKATRDALLVKAAQSEGLEIVSDGQGGFTVRQGVGVGSGGKPMKESEAKANIYADRMEAANQTLDTLEGEGTSLFNTLASKAGTVGNYALTPEYRQYEQAQRDFLNAVLRQESGAVISEEEFDNGRKQYFPQPGDDPQTIAQKKRNRQTAIRAIRKASGQPTSEIIPIEQSQAPAPSAQTSGDGVVSYKEYFGAP